MLYYTMFRNEHSQLSQVLWLKSPPLKKVGQGHK